MATSPTHDSMANAIRFLTVDAVEKAKSGHPGLPMGMADVATLLFRDVLKFDAADPLWPDRDRFVLSGGHGSMLLYALAYLTGMAGDKGLTIDDLKAFRQVGSKTPGHPEYGHTVGVETTTGPLGQGIATAVGMAIAERMMAAQFPSVVDHRTYVIASDGDLMEGVSQEAIAIAGHYGSISSSSSMTTTAFRSTAIRRLPIPSIRSRGSVPPDGMRATSTDTTSRRSTRPFATHRPPTGQP